MNDLKAGKRIQLLYSRTTNNTWFVPIILFLLVSTISLLHYSTPVKLHQFHDLFRRLYYIPLFLTLFRYGLRGGVIIAVLITAFYLPHFFFHHGGLAKENLSKILEISLLFIFTAIFGFLQNRVIHTGNALDSSNKKLRETNEALRATTKQLLAAEEAIRLNDRIKTVADLTASFAHEIKNPLASLSGAARICETEGSGTTKKFASIVGEETRRLNRILENFLSFVKDRNETIKHSDLLAEASHALSLTDLIREQRSLELRNRLGRTIRIREPEGSLSRAIFNLLKNAVEATDPERGTVRLSLNRHGEYLAISVLDNGPGLQTGIHPLDPFVTTKTTGTGLGLTIVYKTVQSLGGSVRWRRLRNTTVFTMLLPVKGDRPHGQNSDC